MPYLVKAERVNSELPESSIEVVSAERAERTYRGFKLDGYETVYVITPDGRRLGYFDKAIAAEEDRKSHQKTL